MHIDGNGHFKLLIETHCRRTVQDNVDILLDGLTLIRGDAQPRQGAVAADDCDLAAILWINLFHFGEHLQRANGREMSWSSTARCVAVGVAYRIVKQILNARMGILALLGAYQQIYLCHLGDAQQFLDDDCGNKSIVSGEVDELAELAEPVCVLKYAQHVHTHTDTQAAGCTYSCQRIRCRQ